MRTRGSAAVERRRGLATAGVGALLVLLLAACPAGSDDANETSSGLDLGGGATPTTNTTSPEESQVPDVGAAGERGEPGQAGEPGARSHPTRRQWGQLSGR